MLEALSWEGGLYLLMDVFEIVTQLVFSSIIAFSILCAKKKKKKAQKFALSKSSSSSLKPKKPAAVKGSQDMKTTTDYDMKLMPSQIRAVMEAEQMAKSNKGYDNFDIDMDDVLDDDKKTKKG